MERPNIIVNEETVKVVGFGGRGKLWFGRIAGVSCGRATEIKPSVGGVVRQCLICWNARHSRGFGG